MNTAMKRLLDRVDGMPATVTPSSVRNTQARRSRAAATRERNLERGRAAMPIGRVPAWLRSEVDREPSETTEALAAAGLMC